MCYYLLHLYSLFIESGKHHLKTLFIPSMTAFYFFLDKSDEDSSLFEKSSTVSGYTGDIKIKALQRKSEGSYFFLFDIIFTSYQSRYRSYG